MAKFGTVEWQDEMVTKIDSKLEKGEPLDHYEEMFLEIQAEHNSRILEGLLEDD